MKKLYAIVLSVFLLFSYSFAENIIDLDSLTNEELESLYYQIGAKLYGEKILGDNGVKFLIGNYTVGKDLPVGSYVLTVQDEPNSSDTVFIGVYENADENSKQIMFRSLDSVETPYLLLNDLENGNYIYMYTYGTDPGLRLYTLSAYMNQLD